MRPTPLVVFVSLLLLMVSPIEPKKPGKGRGLKGVRNTLSRDRVRPSRRHSRSNTAPACTESTESKGFFVDCQELRLTSIPGSHVWSKRPKHLLLARNQIKAVRDNALAGYEALVSLDLQQNQIFLVEEGAFQGLTHLTTLLLQHNRLTTLTEETLLPLPSLKYLRLHQNPWKCFCSMDSFVRTLQVPSNRYLGNHARCDEPLMLKGKKLKQIDPELLCKEHNSTSSSASNQTSTTDQIQPVHFRSKPDATTSCHTYLFPQVRMDCRNRGLTEVPTGIPADVVHIDLSNNKISQLKARDFQGARSLKTLNLSSNSMERLDTASLFGLLHLRELDLSNNDLHFIQYGVLEDLYFLSQLKLEGNPWVCDYSIHYMVYWLRLHPMVRHSGLRCRSPIEHVGESVELYVNSYNRDCPKERQPSQADSSQTDSDTLSTAMELQRDVEEELEPRHLRKPQKYEIIQLS